MNPEDKAGQYFEKVNAVIRVGLKLDPESMTNEMWAQKFQEWVYVQRLEQMSLEATLKKVVQEYFSG